MILLEEVFKIAVEGSKRVGLLLHSLLGIKLTGTLYNLAAQLHVGNIVADSAALKRLYDILLKGIERLELFALLHKNNVVTHGRKERCTHLSGSQSEGCIFELLESLRWSNPR